MKPTFLLLSAFLFICSSLFAQGKGEPSVQQREQWMKEMRTAKAEYIARELKLTDDQKAKFVPLYESMDEEVNRLGDETRSLEKTIRDKGDKATDLEYEKASEALFELKDREASVELKYMNEFKKVLSPRQMFEIKGAERSFTREVMRQHRHKNK